MGALVHSPLSIWFSNSRVLRTWQHFYVGCISLGLSKECTQWWHCIVASYVNEILTHKMKWHDRFETEELGEELPSFEGYIGCVDDTLVKIRQPYKDPNHTRFFNGRNKNSLYQQCNDYWLLWISFHLCWLWLSIVLSYCHILRASSLHANWRAHFTHINWYFTYVLGTLAIEVLINIYFLVLDIRKLQTIYQYQTSTRHYLMSFYYLTN